MAYLLCVDEQRVVVGEFGVQSVGAVSTCASAQCVAAIITYASWKMVVG